MAKMKFSKTMPKGEARPLGTPKPRVTRAVVKGSGASRTLRFGPQKLKAVRFRTLEIKPEEKVTEIALQPPAAVVESSQSATEPNKPTAITPREQDRTMTLTLKGYNKKGNAAIYSGLRATIRVALINFPDKQAPTSIELPDGVFAAPAVKQPKVKLTAEERAAARAAKPKPTAAERVARMEARLAKERAKLEAEAVSM